MNMKIIIEDSLITYDDEKGIIFLVKTGDFIACSPSHAKKLYDLTQKYKNNQLNVKEKNELEIYYKSIIKNSIRECITPKGLDKVKKITRLEFIVSTKCNLDCIYCYANAGTYNYNQLIMTPKNIENYFNSIINAGYIDIKTIMFFGGEPCLAKDAIKKCCEMVYSLYESKKIISIPRFTMVTNGTLLSDDMIDIIKKYNILTTVSLDGPKDINDKLRIFKNKKGSYDKILSGINKMNKAGCPPNAIEATYTKLHQEANFTKERLKKYLIRLSGTKKIIIENCAGKKNTKIAPNVSNNETRKSLIYDVNFIYGLGARTYSSVSCGAGLSSFAVLPDGTLYPCHLFIEKKEYEIGKINKNEFNLSNYNNVKVKLLSISKDTNNECKLCWRKSICIDCPASRLLYKEEACSYKLVYSEKDMINFAKLKSNTLKWNKVKKELKKLHRE